MLSPPLQICTKLCLINHFSVRKVFYRTRRTAKRQWKLKRLVVYGNIVGNETASVADEFQGLFDAEKAPNVDRDDDDDHPEAPSLAEMLEDLKFDDEETKEAAESADEEAMQE
ncbi:hypothetical protein B9Z55_000591 [Caenorhabditis nigoni]|uniref:Uncharacterized protein n=1 Tax=Caenorhabditis nigoni TaxID=1611254 RepID=A0A2G5VTU8_9PELO|nr:hypothetical protein B9Z55_000591 [Caenorhabditis nigoni]